MDKLCSWAIHHPLLVQVIVKQAKQASGVNPFETVYGTKPTNTSTVQGCNGCSVLKSALLVFKLPLSDAWAIVVNRAGPAECFFNPNNDQGLLDACKDT